MNPAYPHIVYPQAQGLPVGLNAQQVSQPMQPMQMMYQQPALGVGQPYTGMIQQQQIVQPHPAPPPEDPQQSSTIEKLAAYVIKNGLEFEEVMKRKEMNNPKFSFLWPGGKHYDYYQWALHCSRTGIPLHMPIVVSQPSIQQTQNMQPQHMQGVINQVGVLDTSSQQNVVQYNTQPQQQIIHIQQGEPDLSVEESAAFDRIVNGLSGSREFIVSSRDWVLSVLPGGKGPAVAQKLRKFIQNLGSSEADQAKSFLSCLYAVYLLHDIFFAPKCPPVFKQQCLPQLPTILRAAFVLSPTPQDAEKLGKVVNIWSSKGLFGDSGDMLTTAVTTRQVPLAAPPSPVHVPQIPAPFIPPVVPHQPQPQRPIMGQLQAQIGQSPSPNMPLQQAGLPLQQQQNQMQSQNQSPFGVPQLQSQVSSDSNTSMSNGMQVQQGGGYQPQQQAPSALMPPAQFMMLQQQQIQQQQHMIMLLAAEKSQLQQQSQYGQPSMPMMYQQPSPYPPMHMQNTHPIPNITSISSGQMFPVSAGMAPHGQEFDTLPVGVMVGIIKGALRTGNKPYNPIDLAKLPPTKAPHIEPGRLEVRVSEYYKRLTLDDDKREREREKEDRRQDRDRDRDRDSSDRHRSGYSSRSRRGGSRERDSGRRRDDRERDGGHHHRDRHDRDRDRDRSSRRDSDTVSLPSAVVIAPDKESASITEENVGYQALKKMGWQEGAGLGAAGTGIAEPVGGGGQLDKVGVGGRPAEGEEEDPYLQYRKSKSYNNYR